MSGLRTRVRVDDAQFMEWVRRYAAAMERDLGEVLEEQMGRVLVAAAAFTPPFPRGSNGARVWQRTVRSDGKPGRQTIRWSDHKEAGRNAILTDMVGRAGRKEGLFEVHEREWFERIVAAIELLGEGGGYHVTRLERARLVGTLRMSLPLGWEESGTRAEYKEFLEPDASVGVMESHHRRYRSRSTGRTSRRSRRGQLIGRSGVNDVMHVTPKALQRYLKVLWSRVGTGKRGWWMAGSLLGLNVKAVPRWVQKTRGQGRGEKRLRGWRKFIRAANLVPWLVRQDRTVGIRRNALRFAGKNLEKQVVHREKQARRRSMRGVRRPRRR